MSGTRQPEAAGVTHALAVERASRVSDIRCALVLGIDAGLEDPVEGAVTLQFQLTDADAPLVLDFSPAPACEPAGAINGHPHEIVHEHGHLILPAATLRPGTNTVHITFTAGREGLHRTTDFLYSLFVPARASHVFPCFDQPDLKTRWTVTLDVPQGWTAASNGRTTSVERAGPHDRYVFAETPPLPTYLLAFVAGRLTIDVHERDGRSFRVIHREPDEARYDANADAVVALHHRALEWLETWTAVPYPFDSFDIVLVPGFQFGGMEHPGVIYYHADLLLLDRSATPRQHLSRAHVIAHETTHLWFGDMVTMTWFDDVWLKEVLANVMAAKILAAWYPDEPHDLRFLVQHYPAAYDVDRTAGANAIRQPLANLDEAGSLYGPIIYLKSPVVFRQLERLVGADAFRDALHECLSTYRFGNVDWPTLLAVFSRRTDHDLETWSRDWIETPGRPTLAADVVRTNGVVTSVSLPDNGMAYGEVVLDEDAQEWLVRSPPTCRNPVDRAAAYIVLWDAMLGGRLHPAPLFESLLTALTTEPEDLTRQLLIDQTTTTFWRFTPAVRRASAARRLEEVLFDGLRRAAEPWRKAVWFTALRSMALSDDVVEWLESVWLRARHVDGLPLSDLDETALALDLAIRLPAKADAILATQQARTTDADRAARLAFLAPAASGDPSQRDAFFRGLADPARRTRESWVLDAMRILHHPLRARASAHLVCPALSLAREIQQTGDIFFPRRWIDATLAGYQDASVAADVRHFIQTLPEDYPHRLRNHLLVAADPLERAAAWMSRMAE